MKKYNFNPLKTILLVMLLCITGYLVISKMISWTIKTVHRPAPTHYLSVSDDPPVTQCTDSKFKLNDRAIFDFTGDTVLIIGNGKDYPFDEEKYWQVQIIEPNNKITEMDLPEQFLIPLQGSINH